MGGMTQDTTYTFKAEVPDGIADKARSLRINQRVKEEFELFRQSIMVHRTKDDGRQVMPKQVMEVLFELASRWIEEHLEEWPELCREFVFLHLFPGNPNLTRAASPNWQATWKALGEAKKWALKRLDPVAHLERFLAGHLRGDHGEVNQDLARKEVEKFRAEHGF